MSNYPCGVNDDDPHFDVPSVENEEDCETEERELIEEIVKLRNATEETRKNIRALMELVA